MSSKDFDKEFIKDLNEGRENLPKAMKYILSKIDETFNREIKRIGEWGIKRKED